MGNIVREALMLPIRNYRDAFFVFWPVGLFYALYIVWSLIQPTQIGQTPSLFTVLVVIGVVLYLILLTVIGIVNWHRKLVTGNRIEELHMVPQSRDWKYLGFFILISLAVAVVTVISISLISLLLAPLMFNPQAKPSIGSVLLIWFLMMVVYLVVLGFLARLFLVLPRVSVEDQNIHWPLGLAKKFNFGAEGSNAVVAVFFLSSLPSVLVSIVLMMISLAYLSPPDPSGGTIALSGELRTIIGVGNIISLFTSLYAALAFASVLSLLYRDYVQPALRLRPADPQQ